MLHARQELEDINGLLLQMGRMQHPAVDVRVLRRVPQRILHESSWATLIKAHNVLVCNVGGDFAISDSCAGWDSG